jgi:DNA repair exonuclease SbcCD ATPase subunit
MDAISFALFGKPFRNINKPQLINSITGKNLVVELEFTISASNYKVVRGMRPSVFELYVSGSLLNQSADARDYQTVFEKSILKMSHKTFSQVVVLGAATFQPFMQLPAGRRREIVEDILDLQVFTKMNSLLRDRVQKLQEEAIKITSDKRIVAAKVDYVRKQQDESAVDVALLLAEKSELISRTQAEMESTSREIDELKFKSEKLPFFQPDYTDAKSKLELVLGLKHKIEANRSVINRDVNFFKKNTTCPTCKRPIDEHFRDESIGEKQIVLDELESGLSKIDLEISGREDKIKAMDEVRSMVSSINIEIARRSMKLSSLLEYISSLESDFKRISKRSEVDLTTNLSALMEESREIEQRQKTLNDRQQVFNVLAALLKDGGIKAKIVKQYVPIINRLINKYLSVMEMTVQFELDENFDEKIRSRHRDEYSYFSFSEGEKQRIDLALLFTWRAISKMRNSASTNLLILDEVFDSSLDATAIDGVMEIIRQASSESNIVVISHKEQLVDRFNQIIRFEKVKNFSQIC